MLSSVHIPEHVEAKTENVSVTNNRASFGPSSAFCDFSAIYLLI